jgi:hypothetical protein
MGSCMETLTHISGVGLMVRSQQMTLSTLQPIISLGVWYVNGIALWWDVW